MAATLMDREWEVDIVVVVVVEDIEPRVDDDDDDGDWDLGGGSEFEPGARSRTPTLGKSAFI